ncbi:MAG: DUF4124 domain-containing protein [Gammaproteobacteria bacterium]|nr:DUF4124 domain-containing protein [Gammaproteobacteria bacterium]
MKQLFAFIVLLLLASLPAQAEIYRGVDEDGNVFYSDKEQPESELIPTPTSNTVTMPKPVAKPHSAPQNTEIAYKAFTILSPANDSIIRDNTGNLSVTLSIEPELNVKNGDFIRLSIDNQVVTPKTTSLSTLIPDIDRGSHSLKAELVSGSGKSILSHSIQFHLKRFSTLH